MDIENTLFKQARSLYGKKTFQNKYERKQIVQILNEFKKKDHLDYAYLKMAYIAVYLYWNLPNGVINSLVKLNKD